MREFATGATRNDDQEKLDYEGFLSPFVLEEFARYMHRHREQADGTLRQSDNWQRGMPQNEYMKSAFRHFMEWWSLHRRRLAGEAILPCQIDDAAMALLFNLQGYMHEELREQDRR